MGAHTQTYTYTCLYMYIFRDTGLHTHIYLNSMHCYIYIYLHTTYISICSRFTVPPHYPFPSSSAQWLGVGFPLSFVERLGIIFKSVKESGHGQYLKSTCKLHQWDLCEGRVGVSHVESSWISQHHFENGLRHHGCFKLLVAKSTTEIPSESSANNFVSCWTMYPLRNTCAVKRGSGLFVSCFLGYYPRLKEIIIIISH